MGYYINTRKNGEYLNPFSKADILVQDGDAVEISYHDAASANHATDGILVEISMPMWNALGFVYSHQEWIAFNRPTDTRSKRYFLMDRELAEKLSGYKR